AVVRRRGRKHPPPTPDALVNSRLAERVGPYSASDAGSAQQACPGCGFCRDELRTGDAAVALSSLPHWWRQLFGLNGDRELLRRRVGSESWSALEHGAHVRDMLHAKANSLERIQDGERPQITRVVLDAQLPGDKQR